MSVTEGTFSRIIPDSLVKLPDNLAKSVMPSITWKRRYNVDVLGKNIQAKLPDKLKNIPEKQAKLQDKLCSKVAK